MINTLKPSQAPGHDAEKGEVLKKIMNQYGTPEEKQRDAVKKLGKDEFFKIMITQIQHQDPLKPYQNEDMAAQMAQFTSLEQMMNVNSNLEKLTQSQMPLHQLGATNLIGKQVTTDSSRLAHEEGRHSDLKFNLPVDAAKVRVALLNDKGEVVRELEQENLSKGDVSIPWDGKRSNNLPVPSGTYFFRAIAETEQGKNISVSTQSSQVVSGISFDGKELVLLTGDPQSPGKVLLKNVSKIVDLSSLKNSESQALQSTQATLPALASAPSLKSSSEQAPQLPGLASKFMPMRMSDIQGASPQKLEKNTNSELKTEVESINPAAKQMQQAQALRAVPSSVPPPAHLAREKERAVPSSATERAVPMNPSSALPATKLPGKTLPSSVEGSTAGQWLVEEGSGE